MILRNNASRSILWVVAFALGWALASSACAPPIAKDTVTITR